MTFDLLKKAHWQSLTESEKLARWTDLRHHKPGFSSAAPGGGGQIPGKIVMTNVKLNDDLLHLTLVNETSKRSGEIWVDVKTRKVVKAMEDGDITFPSKDE